MLVKDVMTKKVVSVTPDAGIAEIAQLLLKHHISGVPVIDEEERLVGVVSEGDLMRRISSAEKTRRSWWLELFAGEGSSVADYVKAHARKASDVMSSDVTTVTEDMSIATAAALLESQRIKRMPVLRGDKLVGIISRSNLLQGLAAAPEMPDPSTDDRVIQTRIQEALNEVPGLQQPLINVLVTDGVASIYGVVDSDFMATAVRLAVEGVVGDDKTDIQLSRFPSWGYGYGI